MGLNALHVPLVHYGHNIFAFCVVNFFKNALVSMINENFLLFWSDFVEKANKIVDTTSVDRLSESLASSDVNCIDEVIINTFPSCASVGR